MKHPRLTSFLIALPTLLYIGALFLDPGRSLVLWERTPQFDWANTWPLILGLGAYSLLVHQIFVRLPESPSRPQIIVILFGTLIAGLLLQTAAVHVVEPYPLRATLLRQYSPFTGGYWNIGTRVENLSQFLDSFAEQMPRYAVHAQRHPPGLPLIFWVGNKFFELAPALAANIAAPLRPLACFDPLAIQLSDIQIASGAFGVLIESLLAWLIPSALFMFVRRISNTRTALLAAMLYPLVPGALAWTSQFDRGFGLITVLGLYGCERMLGRTDLQSGRSSPIWALFTGVVFSVGTFMSIGNAPIILIGALYMAARLWQQERLTQWRWRLVQAVLVLIGVASLWLLSLPTGFDPLGMYRVIMQTHLDLDRPFWPFVVWHAWDIITFIGIPFVMLALVAIKQPKSPAQSAVLMSCFGTLLILCLAHVARGETGRVWMFFAPLPVVVAALYLCRGVPSSDRPSSAGHSRQFTLITLLALLVLQGSAQMGWLRFIGYGVDSATVVDAVVPTSITATNIRYGRDGQIALLGFEAQPSLKPGDYSDITLYWQLDSAQPLTRSYKIFVHYAPTLDDLGNLNNTKRIVNQDGIPMNWNLPTTCWRPGQIVRDQHGIRIDPSAQPGDYLALLGLYEETSGEREFVHTAQQAKDFAVALPIKIRITK